MRAASGSPASFPYTSRRVERQQKKARLSDESEVKVDCLRLQWTSDRRMRRRPSAALLLAALVTQACIHHIIGALGQAVADEPEHWVARTDPAEQLQDVLQDAAEALCQEQINAFADCIESQMECNATTTRCQNHPQEAMERCTALQMS